MNFHRSSKQERQQQEEGRQKKKGEDFLPHIPIAALGGNLTKSKEGNQYVHSFDEIVTFRKKTEKNEITQDKQSKNKDFRNEIDKLGLEHQNLISEQNAKSQLLEASDSLRRKETVVQIEIPKDTFEEESLKNDISAFSMRQVNYLKKATNKKEQIKYEQIKRNIPVHSSSSDDLQQKEESLRQRTNMILDRLMASNLRQKRSNPENCIKINSMNVRDQTIELCNRALLKTKSIYMNLNEFNNNSSSLSSLRNNIDFSRRKRSKKFECLHQIQYSKLIKEIQDIQGVNNLMISKLNTQEKPLEEQQNNEEKLSKDLNKNSYIPSALQKRIKLINRKIKTTIQNHPSQQLSDINVVDGIGLKKYSTVQLNNVNEERDHNNGQIFKSKMKKKRCNSMMIQIKENDNSTRYKMSKILHQIRQDRQKQKQPVQESLQPIGRSISYTLKDKTPDKDSLISEPKQLEPNIKVNLQVSSQNRMNIINSIKLFSETRKSKNISDILAMERSRFKMTYLMKQVEGKS